MDDKAELISLLNELEGWFVCDSEITGKQTSVEYVKRIQNARDFLQSQEADHEAIAQAHMAGQAEAGIDPNYSNAQRYAERVSPTSVQQEAEPKRHRWDDAGERCLDCGDSDWFAGYVCEPQEAVAEGEPTSHQLHAAYDAHMMHLPYKQSTCHELAADIYRTMRKAAPQPPKAQEAEPVIYGLKSAISGEWDGKTTVSIENADLYESSALLPLTYYTQPPKAQMDDERTILEGLLKELRCYKDAMEYTDIVSAEMLLEHIEWKIESAPAAPAKAKIPGWKLVPIEPTKEMIDSCRAKYLPSISLPVFVAAYKTMITAAPKPTEGA